MFKRIDNSLSYLHPRSSYLSSFVDSPGWLQPHHSSGPHQNEWYFFVGAAPAVVLQSPHLVQGAVLVLIDTLVTVAVVVETAVLTTVLTNVSVDTAVEITVVGWKTVLILYWVSVLYSTVVVL